MFTLTVDDTTQAGTYETSLCDIYTAIRPCEEEWECIVSMDTPVCRSVVLDIMCVHHDILKQIVINIPFIGTIHIDSIYISLQHVLCNDSFFTCKDQRLNNMHYIPNCTVYEPLN